MLALLLLSGAAYVVSSRLGPQVLIPISSAIMARPLGDLPVMAQKPAPDSVGIGACPPEGHGGDPELNILKNRVDKSDFASASFESLKALTWPKTVEGQPMANWSPSNRAFISQYLGIPVVVEGYIVNLRSGGSDAANCGIDDPANPYWSIYLAQNPRDKRAQSIVAVSTPQARYGHTWNMEIIQGFLIAGRWPVRISGWLYFNPDHAEDVGRTRATLWEISPVIQIEVFQDGHWNQLDKYAK